jgi:hypothetical protein
MTKVRSVVSQLVAVSLALLLAVPARANTVQLVADAHVVTSFPTVRSQSQVESWQVAPRRKASRNRRP